MKFFLWVGIFFKKMLIFPSTCIKVGHDVDVVDFSFKPTFAYLKYTKKFRNPIFRDLYFSDDFAIKSSPYKPIHFSMVTLIIFQTLPCNQIRNFMETYWYKWNITLSCFLSYIYHVPIIRNCLLDDNDLQQLDFIFALHFYKLSEITHIHFFLFF